MAGKGEQPARRQDRRDREPERQQRGDQCAEGEQQHEQGDRERQLLGALEVLVDRVADRLVDGRVTGFSDADLRMRCGCAAHRSGDRGDAVLSGVELAVDVEQHQCAVAVRRDLPAVAGLQR